MPNCRQCGSHVTQQWVEVNCPEGVDDPDGCLHCGDRGSRGYDEQQHTDEGPDLPDV